jgi:hypothetical protein
MVHPERTSVGSRVEGRLVSPIAGHESVPLERCVPSDVVVPAILLHARAQDDLRDPVVIVGDRETPEGVKEGLGRTLTPKLT